MSESNPLRVFFLIPPEVQLLDFAGPAHLFYEAKEYGAEIEIHYLSLDLNSSQQSSAGVAIGELLPFNTFELNSNDLLFVPGLESKLFLSEQFTQQHQSFFEWLKKQGEYKARICSVCTGAYLLGIAGLLDNKECTTHWKYLDDFKQRFPDTEVLTDRLIVKDDNIYSSAGVSSGIDLSLFILEELFGAVFASKIAKEVVIYARRTSKDPQLSIYLQFRNHLENRIHEVQDILSQNLDIKIKIEELSEMVHMSRRNLTRLFKTTTGITIGEYLEKLRVEHAKQLIENGSKVNTAAVACGLKSSNQLRTLLKKHTITP